MAAVIRRRKLLSRVLLLAGAALVLGAFALEFFRFPWASLGGGAGGDASVPDPTPIVLERQDQSSRVVDAAPERSAAEVSEAPESSATPAAGVLPGTSDADCAPAAEYIQLGILKIPRLEVSQYVLEGTDRQLLYGAGHVAGTAGLGQAGNCAVAGHNTSCFRYLHLLQEGDTVLLKAEGRVFTYSVYESLTVLPDELWVLDLPEEETAVLTLITCTPYLVSSHRLIVRARLSDVDGMPPEEYFAGLQGSDKNS